MAQHIDIKINEYSYIPKYRQVADSIKNEISSGKIKMGEKIPSINTLSNSSYLSRDTIEKAYKLLKKQKVIISVKGKGYYILQTEFFTKVQIFFMINKLSPYKMMIYNSFLNNIGVNTQVTLSVYHCDEEIFTKNLENNLTIL